MSKQTTFDDIDLMQYADGELPEATAQEIAAYLESGHDQDASHKVQALGQMSDTLRSYLELEADAAEPRLDALWEVLEHKISDRAAKDERASMAAPAQATAQAPGLWASIVRFFEGYRGHILTGAVAAGAAAAIILALRPPEKVVIEKPIAVRAVPDKPSVPSIPDVPNTAVPDAPNTAVPDAPNTAVPEAVFVKDESSAPEIEELDVRGGSGTVFMVPAEGEGDVSATVIFIDFNDAEGPII